MTASYDRPHRCLELCDGESDDRSGSDTLVLLRRCCRPCIWRWGCCSRGWTLLFLFRIVLTWYPQVDLNQGLMRLVAAPTEPLSGVPPAA